MPRNPDAAKTSILDAAQRLLMRDGSWTLDQVAAEARCAKGLIHYHFRAKNALLRQLAERMERARERAWTKAFDAPSPAAAIERSWRVLLGEARNGTTRAWLAMRARSLEKTGRLASAETLEFRNALSAALGRFLESLGLATTVPLDEAAGVLSALVEGIGLQLAAGIPEEQLHGAYAAAWLGILSLTSPSA